MRILNRAALEWVALVLGLLVCACGGSSGGSGDAAGGAAAAESTVMSGDRELVPVSVQLHRGAGFSLGISGSLTVG